MHRLRQNEAATCTVQYNYPIIIRRQIIPAVKPRCCEISSDLVDEPRHFGHPCGVWAGFRPFWAGYRKVARSSGTGRGSSRVPELGQKTFRLPPPKRAQTPPEPRRDVRSGAVRQRDRARFHSKRYSQSSILGNIFRLVPTTRPVPELRATFRHPAQKGPKGPKPRPNPAGMSEVARWLVTITCNVVQPITAGHYVLKSDRG